MSMRLRLFAVALPVLLGTVASVAVRAETVEEFYKKNQQITLLIGNGGGSGHEVWARLIGQFLPKYIPGNPTIIVRPMPGAGGLIMANHLYNQAPKDGTWIGAISASLPALVLAGLDNAKVDPQKLLYLGSAELSDHGCIVATKNGINSVEDAKKQEVPLAGGGGASNSAFMPPIVNKMTGTKFKVINGYPGGAGTFLALERDEVWGTCSKLDTALRWKANNPNSGAYKIIFHYNRKPIDADPTIPTIFDYIAKKEDVQMMTFIHSSANMGRPYVLPPGVPQDRLEALRKAFADMGKDPGFLDQAKKQKLVVTMTSGDELTRLVTDLYQTPPDVVKQAAAMLPEGAED
jgi:tripartite-type tricarboxylate transporter receptor subunit TctC